MDSINAWSSYKPKALPKWKLNLEADHALGVMRSCNHQETHETHEKTFIDVSVLRGFVVNKRTARYGLPPLPLLGSTQRHADIADIRTGRTGTQ